ncbi:MAG: S8 family serine peptidase, partial [Thermodesulfobacteriota bacterium]
KMLRRFSLPFTAFLALLLLSGLAPRPARATILISLYADRLSLCAKNTPLSEVLAALARRGISVRQAPSVNPTVSVCVSDLPIAEAVERILKGTNYVLTWTRPEKSPGIPPRLAEIQVFPPGAPDRALPLSNSSRFSVVTLKSGAKAVKDEILMRFPKGMTEQAINELLKKISGSIVSYDEKTGIARISLPPDSDIEAAVAAANQAGKAKAEPNYAYPVDRSTYLPGQKLFTDPNAPPVPKSGHVPVAILDTGMDAAAANMEGLVVGSLDALDPDQPLSDNLGHGTQMALVASGKIRPEGAKESTAFENPVVAVRAFDDQGITTSYTLIRAVDYAVENGARVINCSWGTSTDAAFIRDSLEYAHSQGVVLVAAAGNEPTGEAVYPAAYPFVVGVGARNPLGITWDKSNYGSSVAVIAPGFADLPVGYEGPAGTYAGTSIASAFVAGVVADTLSQNPDATPEEIMNAVADSF